MNWSRLFNWYGREQRESKPKKRFEKENTEQFNGFLRNGVKKSYKHDTDTVNITVLNDGYVRKLQIFL